jgi:hypothetical protein
MPLIRIITAVNYNSQGHVQYVRWGLADTDSNLWQVMPETSHVIHVLEALKYGEDVWTVIAEGDRVVPGPRVHAVKLRPGLKTIEAMPGEGGTDASLAQLPVF